MTVKVLRILPHSGEKKYTQGFEIIDGILYESTGLDNQSSLKKIDLQTGGLLFTKDLQGFFAEGITAFGGRLILLTYKNGKAYTYTIPDLKDRSEYFTYSTEGWGLTNNGKELIMSDGSDKLFFRNPETFEISRVLSISIDGKPLYYINELEYADSLVYANIYGSSMIMAINPQTGNVEMEIDASGLDCARLSNTNQEAVLNGIAYNPASKTFYITGKLCPHIYEVLFEEIKDIP